MAAPTTTDATPSDLRLDTVTTAATLRIGVRELRDWERDFGFPRSVAPPGRRREFVGADVHRLAAALRKGLPPAKAIIEARFGSGQPEPGASRERTGSDQPAGSVTELRPATETRSPAPPGH